MAVKDMMIVPTLCVLLPWLIFKPESWVTAQKKLSLAWDMAIAPAPVAKTAKTLMDSESKPREPSNGATMEAVVIMATVDEPWAVFKEKAIKKGRKIPQLALPILLLTISPIPEF